MAEYLTLPTGNLHTVPEEVTDQDACFAEPLAAACRIAEQQVCSRACCSFPSEVIVNPPFVCSPPVSSLA